MKQRTAFEYVVNQALSKSLIESKHFKWSEITENAKDFILNTMMRMFLEGEIDFKNPEKFEEEGFLKRYCRNVINDNLIKNTKFNGGTEYTPKTKRVDTSYLRDTLKLKKEIALIDDMLQEGTRTIGHIKVNEETLYSLRKLREDLCKKLEEIIQNRKIKKGEINLIQKAQNLYGEEASLVVGEQDEF
jgi:hypothetical protein